MTPWLRVAGGGALAWCVLVAFSVLFPPGGTAMVLPLAFVPWLLPMLAFIAITVGFYGVHRAFPDQRARPFLAFLLWLFGASCAGCLGLALGSDPPMVHRVDGRTWAEVRGYVDDSITGTKLYDCGRLALVCGVCAVNTDWSGGRQEYAFTEGNLTVGGADVDPDHPAACR